MKNQWRDVKCPDCGKTWHTIVDIFGAPIKDHCGCEKFGYTEPWYKEKHETGND